MRLVRIAWLGFGLAAIIATSVMAQSDGAKPVVGSAMSGAVEEQVEAGREIYAAQCAACHGVRLEGQPEWRRRRADGRMPAPPHNETGHSWHHSDDDLFTITKHGLAAVVPGYESDMPAFSGTISDSDILAVLAYIKSTWPERQRAYQAAVSGKQPDEK